MHKNYLAHIMIAVILGIVAFGPSIADADTIGPSNTSYTTGIWIANRATSAATVVVDFYSSNGGSPIASYSLPSTIPIGGVSYVYVGTNPSGLAAGTYSAVVSSDQDIAALANTWGSKTVPAGTAVVRDSYLSFQDSDVSMNLYAPVFESSYYGNNTSVSIQNTTSTPGNITLIMRAAGGANPGTIAGSFPYAIGAYGFVTATASSLGLPGGSSNGLYSIQVTSTVNIAGIVSTYSDAADNGLNFGGRLSVDKPALYQYPMKSNGGQTIYAAKNFKGYYNFISSLSIQNIGLISTTVYLTYTTVQSGAISYSKTIAPGEAWVHNTFSYPELPGTPLGVSNNYAIFPAIASASQPLLAMVGTLDLVHGFSSAAVAGNANDLGTNFFVPVAFKVRTTGMSGGQLFSSLTFMNPSASSATIYVYANSVAGVQPLVLSASKNGGQAVANFTNDSTWPSASGGLPMDSITSLTITSTEPIFGVVGYQDLLYYQPGYYGDSGAETLMVK